MGATAASEGRGSVASERQSGLTQVGGINKISSINGNVSFSVARLDQKE
jgi:hypothetical protein